MTPRSLCLFLSHNWATRRPPPRRLAHLFSSLTHTPSSAVSLTSSEEQRQKRVAVAMSGGVDSSVAALLLKQQ